MSANTNVVTIRGTEYKPVSVARKEKHQKHQETVISILEKQLERAKNGELGAVALAVVDTEGVMLTEWATTFESEWKLMKTLHHLTEDYVRAKARE